MKIIQVNSWTGRLLYPLLHFIEREDPDIVFVQEVLSSAIHNPLFDMFSTRELLEKQFEHSFFSATHSFEALEAEVELGNAIFSKYPLSDQQTLFISGEYRKHQQSANYSSNIRNLQSCTVTVGDKRFSLVNHHGFHDLDPQGNGKTLECMQKVIDHLQTLKQPLIFCGDLNIAPNSKAIKLLEQSVDLRNLVAESGAHTTLSSVFRVPGVQVVADYIFASPDIVDCTLTVSDALVSDHKALILEF